MLRWAILLAAGLMWPAALTAQTTGAPLVLEAKIPLGAVSGRIDHLGIDAKRRRLFVAELGNNSVGVVDLAAGKVLRRITGLSEPQGVAYVQFADSVFVANAGDGSVRVLLVGYGKGALAVIDPVSLSKTGDIRLKAHPEGFQIDETGTEVFVNVPDAHEIVVGDLAGESSRSLPTQGAGSNFPMAIGAAGPACSNSVTPSNLHGAPGSVKWFAKHGKPRWPAHPLRC